MTNKVKTTAVPIRTIDVILEWKILFSGCLFQIIVRTTDIPPNKKANVVSTRNIVFPVSIADG